jgi:hypothetical protein
LAVLVACGQSGEDDATSAEARKVPITTASAEARELYLHGRLLFE